MRLINNKEVNCISGGSEFKNVAKFFSAADTILEVVIKLFGNKKEKKNEKKSK